jgi:ABC-2 type transport system ATP-binding protein
VTTIDVRDLRKAFPSRGGAVQAVDGVSFSVPRGEVFGLLGPNGAGKTTTLRMLTTLLPIDAGTATVAGIDVGRHPGRVRHRIGYVSQLGGADNLATGRENLVLQGHLHGMGRREVGRRVEDLLVLLDLTTFADRKVQSYSGGQRRRLDVALGIVHQPEVLFLDEPSTGLDPQNRANLWDHVRDLARQGTTVVLTTHYLEEAERLCDRVVIVDHGRIVAQGSPEELQREVAGASVTLTLRDPERDRTRALQVVRDLAGVADATAEGEHVRLHVADGASELPELLRRCDSAGVAVAAAQLAEPSLDDVFMARTGRSLRDTGAHGPTSPGGRAA